MVQLSRAASQLSWLGHCSLLGKQLVDTMLGHCSLLGKQLMDMMPEQS